MSTRTGSRTGHGLRSAAGLVAAACAVVALMYALPADAAGADRPVGAIPGVVVDPADAPEPGSPGH